MAVRIKRNAYIMQDIKIETFAFSNSTDEKFINQQ